MSIKFRFHTGSIKSTIRRQIKGITEMFRFHTGSIKSGNPHRNSPADCGFDSILVRLKGHNSKPYHKWKEFRFHTGSIKSCDNTKG